MKYSILSKFITAPKIALLGIALLCAVAGVNFIGAQQATAASLPVHIVAAADRADFCDKQANGSGGFFGLKPWYYYMPDELGVPQHGDARSDQCGVRCFNIFVQESPNECGQTKSDIPGVILVIIDDLLRIAGLIAIVFIVIGAFQYTASRGNSERTASAQSTVIAALTGLAIALVAVALVSFLGNRLS